MNSNKPSCTNRFKLTRIKSHRRRWERKARKRQQEQIMWINGKNQKDKKKDNKKTSRGKSQEEKETGNKKSGRIGPKKHKKRKERTTKRQGHATETSGQNPKPRGIARKHVFCPYQVTKKKKEIWFKLQTMTKKGRVRGGGPHLTPKNTKYK